MVDFKVRRKGYRINRLPLGKRKYLVIPLILAIVPSGVMDRLFYVLKGLDPRTKEHKAEDGNG